MAKQRVTVTMDEELLRHASKAVESGDAESVSAWINDAAAARAGRDERDRWAKVAVAEYEAEFGVMTEEEIEEQRRQDRRNAIVVRGRGSAARRRSRSA